MDKRPFIYVKRITNLSDARYCAGMGVDMLGVVVSPHHEDYVSPSQFKEIMGWVSGPQRVVEITDWESIDWHDLITDYAPDFIHLSAKAAVSRIFPDFPLIIEAGIQDLPNLQPRLSQHTSVRFIIIPADIGEDLNAFKLIDKPLLLTLKGNPQSLTGIQSKTGAVGFILEGSRELSPGFKDYDHLSEILEALDN